ncbi:maleylacetate reductase [Altererythrobacter sp. BO-6]|uniref:maleylacetate reductase n=1 Tax=Altererythrobacter sp. BO-6 TaxID=2604537 RepID=UPI0013E1A31C|nr:maleylacetate reductase [Altererythrobacter sp. BO-6]QIG53775.1 maleylacetate reductase [Altererythrobacter sp. BO-6]
MMDFVFTANPARVIFRPGAVQALAEEADNLGCRRLLLLSTAGRADDARAAAHSLGNRMAAVFTGARMHTPIDVTLEAIEIAKTAQVDGIVSYGGGSTIGLGKAIAFRTDLPQIVLPTTYAGSEMTPILGETEHGVKTTKASPKILPEVVIYDVDLTMSLPAATSGTSGINAIAHAVEALYSRQRNPIVSGWALEGIAALHQALPKIVNDQMNREARSQALFGAWLCGLCLGHVGMSLHHKLCHTLGGSFNLPHAETHTVILPHALAYNAPAIPEVIAQLQAVMSDDPVTALRDLAQTVGAPSSLKALGMSQDQIDDAVRLAVSNPYWNPRPIEASPLRKLLENAWHGVRPVLGEY